MTFFTKVRPVQNDFACWAEEITMFKQQGHTVVLVALYVAAFIYEIV